MKYVLQVAWLLALASIFVAADVGGTVQTSSGAVTGHAARNKTAVSEYLGIPYAQPPLGSLRFAVPLSYNSSNAFKASSYSADCPQMGLSSPPLR
jgi:cholinesterase